MSNRDRDYYLARVQAERTAAERATSDAARTAHLQLADRYRRLVERRQGKGPPAEGG